jgi:hypothetical protein
MCEQHNQQKIKGKINNENMGQMVINHHVFSWRPLSFVFSLKICSVQTRIELT